MIVMHGMNGEDGTLQGMLELANIPYTSAGVGASALGMDKILMKQFFRGGGLPVLPSLWYTRSAFLTRTRRRSWRRRKRSWAIRSMSSRPSWAPASASAGRKTGRSFGKRWSWPLNMTGGSSWRKGLTKPIELNCSVLGYDGETEASPIEMPISGEDYLDFAEKYLASGGSKGMASLHRVLPAPIEDELRDRIQEMSKKDLYHDGLQGRGPNRLYV